MDDVTTKFTIVPHNGGTLDHQFEEGYFLTNFRFYSVISPFLGADEENGRTREVFYILDFHFGNQYIVII